ncbi:MAG: hypothetical protein LC641_01290 [Spirochaeta sp.]|nr:hypothetical protein [Spirochaeta sp.]
MRHKSVRYGILCLIAIMFLLGACATPEPPVVEEPEVDLSEDERPHEPEEDDTEKETKTDVGEHEDEQEDVSDEDIHVAKEDFVISTEMYETTFNEVEDFIAELNEIIAKRDFEQWKGHLTEEYIETHSDADILRERSESPVLSRNDIQLTSIEDYFTWVVVPSRANARLDDLDFIGTDKVEAIMRVRDQGVILYQLKRVDDRWKIDVF